jgi:hypothetical protein
MAEIKADIALDHRLTIAEVTDISAQKPDPKIRVASLDIFRGLTVAVCIHVSLKILKLFTLFSSLMFLALDMVVLFNHLKF